MRFIRFDWKTALSLFLPLVIVLTILQINSRENRSSWYLFPFAYAASSLAHFYTSFSEGVRGTTSTYINLVNTNKENKALKKTLSEYQAQLSGVQELKLENQRLNSLLKFQKKTSMKLLPAKIIASDLIPDHHSIMINRGSKHDVKKDMAVISTVGVVGYIVKVLPNTSQALMLYDRYAVIDALVQRSRTRSLVEGWEDQHIQLSNLHRDEDVQVGDHLVTSGLSNIFPKGLPIGTVTSISREKHGVTQTVIAEPFINRTNLEEVFIVISSEDQNTTTNPVPSSPVNAE